jgi:hypothetical protein
MRNEEIRFSKSLIRELGFETSSLHPLEKPIIGYDMTTGARLWSTNIGFVNVNAVQFPSQGLIAFQDSTISSWVAFNVKTGSKAWTSDQIGEDP